MNRLIFRNILKNGTFTWINILGLSLGFLICLLISSVYFEEQSYDKSWTNSSQLYRIVTIDSTAGVENENGTAYVNLGTELEKSFPEIEAASHMRQGQIYLNLQGEAEPAIKIEGLEAENNVFDLLDVHILEGSAKNLVAGKKNLLISKSFKERYFKGENVIGKTILSADSYSDKKSEYVILGVMDNMPYNSVFRTEFIYLTGKPKIPLNREGWGFFSQQILKLKVGTDADALAKKASQWYANFLGPEMASKTSFRLQPITAMYMEPIDGTNISGNKKASQILMAVAALVLLISCINYINIFAAKTLKRVKQINLHKILGAKRSSLIVNLLKETIMLFFIAACISLLFYFLSLPVLEKFLGYELAYVRAQLIPMLALYFPTILLLSVLVGIYPAFIISRVNTAEALRNKISKSQVIDVWVKKSLIITQFSISLIVIIGLITIKSQLKLVQEKSLGINVDHVMGIGHFGVGEKSAAVKNELANLPGIETVSVSGWTPSNGSGNFSKFIPDPDNAEHKIQVNYINGDVDLGKLLNMELLKGRFLNESDYVEIADPDAVEGEETDGIKKVLLTESTAMKLNISELGQIHRDLKVIPVGIVKDFHSESFHKKIGFTVISAHQLTSYAGILLKVKPGQERLAMQGVQKVMDQFYPGRYLNYNWVDELYEKTYVKESKQAQLFLLFAGMALFISALGVSGLILQSVEQRTKEIGIRKVLGASIMSISNLFNRDYVLIIFLAVLIASPIAWYFSNKWLEDFAYRIEISWWFFGLAALLVFVVTLVTVNLQTIKAGLQNPVKTLRDL
ncbi:MULTISPECIES: FtsX-like permease family protein [Sphingobacterium]|uniref:FtsX-like permease family protein n=1 Tax=Sphingobacterium tenebrionis TaxID=3111775 RepID=A0ABU8I518_9SPHI|nr:FtsX-like permease family protein [Sphingobacterium sp. 1.A.4]